jgi:ribose transport system permease protein
MQNAQPAPGSLLSARGWINMLGEEGFVVIFVVWLLFLSFSTRAFATPDNIATVLRQAAVIAIIAIGEHFVVLLGTMDVSLPSILTVGGVFTGALMVNAHVPVLPALGCVLVLGALLGLANGIIVTRLKINPIITTLGMMYILSGIAFVYTRGRTVYGDALAPMDFLARGRLLGIPAPIFIMFVLYIVFHLVLRYTRFGARVFAAGNNEKASWLAGIKTSRVKQNVFMLAGALAAFAGFMQVARQGSAAASMGDDFLFPVLTAVILGGTSLSGGKGRIFNTLISSIFLMTITNGMILLDLNIYIQKIIQGAILILALSLDRLRTARGGS